MQLGVISAQRLLHHDGSELAFAAAGPQVTLLSPALADASDTALAGLPTPESLVENFRTVTELLRSGKVVSAPR